MENSRLTAERRFVVGKNVRFLRREGLVPANLYGHGKASVALQLPTREVEQVLSRVGGTALVKLELNGEEPRTVLIKEVQRHPVKDDLLHVDFQQVAMTEMIRVAVPLHFVGEAPAAKVKDGMVLHPISSLEVEALPGDLPSHLEVDVSVLANLHDALHVSDISVPPGVQILHDLESIVASVVPSAAAAEEAHAAAEEAAQAVERAEPETTEEAPEA